MKKGVAILAVAAMGITGCGPKQPRFSDGEAVQYDVNGITGTGVVVSAQPRLEGGKMMHYYRVDVGVDGAGERDQPLLHENLVSPIVK